MKKFIILLIITKSFLLYSITAEHIPPVAVNADQVYQVEIKILEGFSEVDRILLVYKGWEAISYQQVELEPGSATDPVFNYSWEDLTAFQPGLEYYFIIADKQGSEQFLPQVSPELNPFRVSITESVVKPGEFILLSPDPDYTSETGDATIAISYFSLQDLIVPGSIKFLLNGKDLTDRAKITSNMVLFQQRKAVPGTYSYQVTALTSDGNSISSPLWKHTVPGEIPQSELNYSGNAVITSRLRQTKSDAEDNNDDNHSFLLNLSGNYRKLKMRSRLYLSSREEIDKQSVNRYSIKLALPYLELVAGDHISYFGKYTASGINSRGLHTNLLLPYYRIYFSYGQIYRNLDGKVDSVSTNYTTYTAGTFQRNSLAFRLEVGSRKTFQFAINASKTKDDKSSLSKKYYISPTDELPFVTPKDNLVFSSDLRLALLQQNLVLGAEWAMSLYNDNTIGGAIDQDSLEADLGEDIPFDPATLENIFIINKNVSPFIPGISSSAYNLYLKWSHKTNLLNISYSVIGGSFNSLAVNYLPKDTSTLSIFDNLSLLQNRLILSLGINLISDNINDEKTATSQSSNLFTQIMYRPVGLPYFSFSYASSKAQNEAENDSEQDVITDLDLRNNNFTFNTGYYVNKINFAPTLFTLGFTNNIYSDEADNSFEYSRSSMTLAARSSFREFPLITFLSYTFALNKDVTETFNNVRNEEDYESKYHSFFCRSEFSLRDDTIAPYADIRYALETGDLQQNSLMGNIGVKALLYKGLNLKTSLGLATYENEDIEDGNYSTINFKLKLQYNF